jgi:hypothetical protein
MFLNPTACAPLAEKAGLAQPGKEERILRMVRGHCCGSFMVSLIRNDRLSYFFAGGM